MHLGRVKITGDVAGDGIRTCTPTAALDSLGSTYETDGPAQVACSQGIGVEYPVGAPGYAYDPTGSSNYNKATVVSQ